MSPFALFPHLLPLKSVVWGPTDSKAVKVEDKNQQAQIGAGKQ